MFVCAYVLTNATVSLLPLIFLSWHSAHQCDTTRSTKGNMQSVGGTSSFNVMSVGAGQLSQSGRRSKSERSGKGERSKKM